MLSMNSLKLELSAQVLLRQDIIYHLGICDYHQCNESPILLSSGMSYSAIYIVCM